MAEEKRLICPSASVTECGRGVRFTVEGAKGPVPAFVVRHAGKVRGYLNRCAHVGVELDAQPGEFFDLAGLYLLCTTHGAAYVPATGYCVKGPCKGLSLSKIALDECDGNIYLLSNKETAYV